MTAPDPYARWSLVDRLQMLAFEAELVHLPRSLIAAIREVRASTGVGWVCYRERYPDVRPALVGIGTRHDTPPLHART